MSTNVDLVEPSESAPVLVEPNRRFVDKLLIAADKACDDGQIPLARELLGLAEMAIQARREAGPERRSNRHITALVRVHRRVFAMHAAQLGLS